MGLVTVDAIVLFLIPTRQVPKADHASVCVVLVVFHLRSMTLGAQRHDVRKLDTSPIGQLERVIIGGIVAGKAAYRTMTKSQAYVKLVYVRNGLVIKIGLAAGVTR